MAKLWGLGFKGVLNHHIREGFLTNSGETPSVCCSHNNLCSRVEHQKHQSFWKHFIMWGTHLFLGRPLIS